jgi:hypothetical protein
MVAPVHLQKSRPSVTCQTVFLAKRPEPLINAPLLPQATWRIRRACLDAMWVDVALALMTGRWPSLVRRLQVKAGYTSSNLVDILPLRTPRGANRPELRAS